VHGVHPTAQLAAHLAQAVRQRLTLGEAYLYSLFMALALSVGEMYDPNSIGSMVFVTLTVFISIYVQSFIIGYVSNVVDNIDQVGKAHREALLQVRLFLRMRRVDRLTTRKIITFLDHTWRMHGGTIPDTQELMAQLPKHLKEELIRSADRSLVQQIGMVFAQNGEIADEIKEEVALTLVMRMKPLVALAEDRLIMQSGCGVPGLFIVISGTCEYRPANPEEEIVLIGKGDCFGYELLANGTPEARVASASVMPLEICEFMFLSAENFEEILRSKQPEHALFIRTLREFWAHGSQASGSTGGLISREKTAARANSSRRAVEKSGSKSGIRV